MRTDITIYVNRGQYPDKSGEKPYMTKKAARWLMRSCDLDWDKALELIKAAVASKEEGSAIPKVIGKSGQIARISVRR